jgi:hypothetical protein
MGQRQWLLFTQSMMKDTFAESNYCTPTYKCVMVRIPMARPGMVYWLKKIKTKQEIPSEEEIYEFGLQLFKLVQLSSGCSIVCLIYTERLMEAAKSAPSSLHMVTDHYVWTASCIKSLAGSEFLEHSDGKGLRNYFGDPVS